MNERPARWAVTDASISPGRTVELAVVLDLLERLASLAGRADDLTGRQIVRMTRDVLLWAPCHVLIFGAGEDTPFWRAANRSGTTWVIEDDPVWCDSGCLMVTYDCKLGIPMSQVTTPANLPAWVLKSRWDVVIVDRPRGFGEAPGREQSIYTAAVC